MPTMGEAPGYHAAAMSLALTAPAGMEVYFTLDGYKPTAASIQYTVPIGLFETTVVRAVVVDPSGALAPSFVETNTYFFGADSHTIRVVSVSGDGLEDGAWVGDEPMHIRNSSSRDTQIGRVQEKPNVHCRAPPTRSVRGKPV